MQREVDKMKKTMLVVKGQPRTRLAQKKIKIIKGMIQGIDVTMGHRTSPHLAMSTFS